MTQNKRNLIMKKIINSHLYDTDTADCVGHYRNNRDDDDFRVTVENLYRKKTGEFFLHGWGGPLTNYAERRGQNTWGYGEEIKPMSLNDAKKWAENHLSGENYIKIFGEVEE